ASSRPSSPYDLNFSSVHWLARFSLSEPVSRGPIMSHKYSRLAINSLFWSISAQSLRSASRNGLGCGAGLVWAASAAAHTTASTQYPCPRARRSAVAGGLQLEEFRILP